MLTWEHLKAPIREQTPHEEELQVWLVTIVANRAMVEYALPAFRVLTYDVGPLLLAWLEEYAYAFPTMTYSGRTKTSSYVCARLTTCGCPILDDVHSPDAHASMLRVWYRLGVWNTRNG